MGLLNKKHVSSEKRQFDEFVDFLRSSIFKGRVNETIFLTGVDRYKDFIRECIAHSETGFPGVRPEKIGTALSTLYSINALLTYQKLGNVKETLESLGKEMDGLLLSKETVSDETAARITQEHSSLSNQLHTLDKVNLLEVYCQENELSIKEVQYILYKLDNFAQLISQHNRNLQ